MKRTTTLIAALLAAVLLTAGIAGAAKPDNPGKPDKGAKAEKKAAKKEAQQRCKAEKKADKRAFKATYGKRAMRTCKKGEKSEVREDASNAAQECKAERAEDPDAFKEEYGTNKNGKNAFGKCVSSKVEEEGAEDAETFENAAQQCRAERSEDRDAFKEEYGTNKNGKNAFGKCVSSKVEEDETEEEPAA